MAKQKIPKGISKEDVYFRKAIIIEHLMPLLGTGVPCAAFPNKKVDFIFMSIDETATHAAKSYFSTLAALRVVEALKKASCVSILHPNMKQSRKMKFKKVYELQSYLSGIGRAKIIVGERTSGRVLHYCITKKTE